MVCGCCHATCLIAVSKTRDAPRLGPAVRTDVAAAAPRRLRHGRSTGKSLRSVSVTVCDVSAMLDAMLAAIWVPW